MFGRTWQLCLLVTETGQALRGSWTPGLQNPPHQPMIQRRPRNQTLLINPEAQETALRSARSMQQTRQIQIPGKGGAEPPAPLLKGLPQGGAWAQTCREDRASAVHWLLSLQGMLFLGVYEHLSPGVT